MIKNIIFDMGNVLLRFDPDAFMTHAGVADEDRELLRREIFQSLEWVRMDRGFITDAQAAELMCRRVPERLRETVVKLVTAWDDPITEIPGMYPLVEELKGLGYGIYLLSNASLRQHEYWPRIPASRFFDGTLISSDVHLVKPQPEFYMLLCHTFSLRPEECFFIDDVPLNMEGAHYCGIQGAVFHNDMAQLRQKLIDAGVPVKPE